MKRGLFYIILVIIIILIALQIKIYFEKPIVKDEKSLDLNTKGIDPLNNDFFIDKSSKIGVLMVHGLGVSTYQTKELSDFLAEKNLTVYSIRLEGHGTNLTDFEKASWKDWYDEVKIAYNSLKQKTEKTYVIGVSSGALLALNLAEQEQIDGVVAIAAPLYLKDWKINLLPIIALFQRYKYFGLESTQVGYAYENIPTKTLTQFRFLVWSTKSQLQKITEPVLIIQSTKDQLVYPKSAEYALENINSTKEKLVMTDIGHAIIRAYENETPEDKSERQKVFNEIYNFIIQ